MNMRRRFVRTVASTAMLCLTGCFEVPVWKYEKYGISATEWMPNEIHDIKFDLSNNAITSLVFTVEGKEYWFRNKHSDLYKGLKQATAVLSLREQVGIFSATISEGMTVALSAPTTVRATPSFM